MQGLRISGTIKNIINWAWFPICEQPAHSKSENYERDQQRHSLISDRYYMYSEIADTVWLL